MKNIADTCAYISGLAMAAIYDLFTDKSEAEKQRIQNLLEIAADRAELSGKLYHKHKHKKKKRRAIIQALRKDLAYIQNSDNSMNKPKPAPNVSILL